VLYVLLEFHEENNSIHSLFVTFYTHFQHMNSTKVSVALIIILLAQLSSIAQINQEDLKHSCKHHKSLPFNQKLNGKTLFKSLNSVSDSIDIIKYTIHLDATDFTNYTTRSWCTIDFESLVNNLEFLPLDLKGQTVDSVIHINGPLQFNHIGEKLIISLNQPMAQGEFNQVTVHYHGGPVVDPSGFGGFYFNSDLAYNIGVAFTDVPHVYGRVWFPCFDNFVEKSAYEFQILSPANRTAYCNGHLVSIDSIGSNVNRTTWVNDHEIPSYLASVAISTYNKFETAFLSNSGDSIPVFLVAKPINLPSLINAFSNLETVFHAFENWFGNYPMEKIGYVLTPVGAMEHSTNIAFPVALAGGGSQSESVMAHELAHEWFGNLATCKTAEDMWLNEGWAEYLSILVYEVLQGENFYKNLIRNNHREMIHKAHTIDGGYLTMNNIPQNVTYGEHVYNKGADMAHTLRGYLGDELFFPAMQSYLSNFAFDNASSEDFRDHLNSIPGIDVTDFFEDWIFQPGWTQFSIDEVSTSGSGGNYNVSLTVNQRLRYAEHLYNNVPVTLSLWDESLNLYEEQVILSDATTQLEVTAPFSPVMWTLNRDEKISYAVTGDDAIYQNTGITNMIHAYFRLTINQIDNPSFIRVEHNWAGPGGTVADNAYIVSPDRYWRIFGNVDENFSATGRVDFDGRNTASGNLDPLLLALVDEDFNEADLVVLYRATPTSEWQLWPEISILSLGSESDGFARITINSLLMGEYTFGIPNPEVSVQSKNTPTLFDVFPNPANDLISVRLSLPIKNNSRIEMYDMEGKLVLTQPIANQNTTIYINNLAAGAYIVKLFNSAEEVGQTKLIVR